MEKNKENIWFWLIAISLMVFAMCVLSLQIIELHQKNDTTKVVVQHDALPAAAPQSISQDVPQNVPQNIPQKPEEEKDLEGSEGKLPPGRYLRVIRSKLIHTPKSMQKINRMLYDVPVDGNSVLWAILRGVMLDDRFISVHEIRALQLLIIKCAPEMGWNQTPQEIMRMFDSNELPDTAVFSLIAYALKCDIILSTSDKNRGYDICAKDGEIFHSDSISEIYKEADDKATIWAYYDVDRGRWAAAIQEKISSEIHESQGKHKVYFLVEAWTNT
ncbi:MAG: hypothetical protein LBJ13_01545 [Puniceicoccales bacterium]|jgi:hypothetical protein|nr:hypothetical protein [Puniceicoccales bacterium]